MAHDPASRAPEVPGNAGTFVPPVRAGCHGPPPSPSRSVSDMSQIPVSRTRPSPMLALVGLLALASLVLSIVSVVDDAPGQVVLRSPEQQSGVPAQPTPEPAGSEVAVPVTVQPPAEPAEPAGPPPAGSGGPSRCPSPTSRSPTSPTATT